MLIITENNSDTSKLNYETSVIELFVELVSAKTESFRQHITHFFFYIYNFKFMHLYSSKANIFY